MGDETGVRETSFLKDLFQMIKELPYKSLLMGVLVTTIFLSLIQIVIADYLRVLMDSLVGENDFSIAMLGIMVLIFAVELGLVYFRTLASEKYSEKNLKYLRKASTDQLMDTSVEEVEKAHSGDFISKLTNDLNKIQTFTKERVHNFIFVPLTAILSMAYLLYLNWILTLISVAMIPVILVVSNRIGKPIGKKTTEYSEAMGRINTMNTEYIKGIEVVKAFHLKDRLMKKYTPEIEDSVKKDTAVARSKAFINSLSGIVSILPFFITFGFGAYFISIGELTLGGLIAFTNLLNYLSFPLSQIPMLIGNGKGDLAAYQRVKSVISLAEERRGGKVRAFDENLRSVKNFDEHSSRRTDLSSAEEVIAIRNLSFTYPGAAAPSLKNISFSIKKNQQIALVGESGSGKTTLSKLLLGFYPVEPGKIEIGGKDLSEWDLKALRQNIAFVPQEVYLFPGDVAENIRYGKPEAGEEGIILAAKKAYADGFIKSLDQGYHTVVGELGDRVSGGQKQRISLARAFIKDSDIVLLDEATSALDNESESLIQQALEQELQKKTAIIIAHRLSTIKEADEIVVMQDGEIVGKGSHQQLIRNNGYYRSLYQKQMENPQGEAI